MRPQSDAIAAPPPRRRHAQVRDVTISFHGANLIENTDFALNYGNRYGFIGPNGSGKSTIMKAIAARCLPIPESIDLFFLDQEYPATDTPALDAVFEVDDERKALVLTQRLFRSSSCVDVAVRASTRLVDVQRCPCHTGSRGREDQ